MQWTKGFQCEGVEGEDVVRLLNEAIARRKVSGFFRLWICYMYNTLLRKVAILKQILMISLFMNMEFVIRSKNVNL